MDMVRIEPVRRYIYSRVSRTGSIAWIRTFKRVVAILEVNMRNRQNCAPTRQLDSF